MSDRWAVALAVASACGAARPSSVPLVVALLAVAAAVLVRRPALLCLAVALLTSVLAARSLAGLDGIEVGPVHAEVTLLGDPEPSGGGLRVDARLGGRRLEARAGGSSSAALADRLAGERLTVRGLVTPLPEGATWLRARHVSGRLTIHAVESWRPGDPASRLANGLRRTLASGGRSLSATERSLFTGLVIGDDRAQPAELADDFLGAGLTHLLAVSGQNVAFVLALAGPLARRLPLWPRLGITLAAIGLFGVMTRFEPSVLRASAMAALAATVTTAGTPVSRLRVLALAVTALLVVDPLLVGSVGFRLSVAASASIVLLAPRLATALPGPSALREALSVTIAAQLGVAPVLLATFGPVPVASLPANLLAVPAAGLVMAWGLTAGMVAGILGGGAATLLQLPTRALLGWLEAVASHGAALPLGELGATHLAVAAAGLALATVASARDRAPLRRLGTGAAVAAVAVAVLSAHAPPPLRSAVAPGIVRWHATGVDVVVLGGAGWRDQMNVRSALEALRRAEIRTIDLLVVTDADVPDDVVAAIGDRAPVGSVLVHAPGAAATALGAAVVPVEGAQLRVGGLAVTVVVAPERLVVDARPA